MLLRTVDILKLHAVSNNPVNALFHLLNTCRTERYPFRAHFGEQSPDSPEVGNEG